MYIKELKLDNFRNYSTLDISFGKNLNVIYGNNAQGKTNMLEAMFLCASGRSHRTSKDYDLVKEKEEGYRVGLKLIKNKEEILIEILYKKEGKKSIRINEIPLKKIGGLMGNLNAVMFSPEDLTIIKDGPAERRRFIDITLSQLRPSYFYDLQQYMRILAHRNVLLREVTKKKSLMDTIETWNLNLVQTGSRIIKARIEFIMKLSAAASKNHTELTGGQEAIRINYIPSFMIEGEMSIDRIENAFSKILEKSLEREIERGTTLYGPQRDDCEILLNDKNVRNYGSQGQQRTAVMSIKLSEIDIMKEETGEYPVLLLDDVMSELDEKRKDSLLERIKNLQTFITCTDESFFKGRVKEHSDYFFVKNGHVYKNGC